MRYIWTLSLIAVVTLSGCMQQQAMPAQDLTGVSEQTRKSITVYEEAISNKSDKAAPYIALAEVYIQGVRESADTRFYERARELVAIAKTIEPNNPEVPFILGSIAAGEHKFQEASDYVEQAISMNPDAARYYGILADAEVELGKYEDAKATVAKMVQLRPDFSSYSRISYLRELYGDLPGAIEAMEAAVTAGASYGENVAWAEVELGKLVMLTDQDKATLHYKAALQAVPQYPRAYQGLAKVALIKGDTSAALTNFEEAYKLLPIAEHALDLGDFYTFTGDTTKANQYYTLVQIGYKQIEESGTNVDLEYARFLAEHGRDTELSLEKAKIAYDARPSIDGAYVYGLALYNAKQLLDAKKYAEEAMKLGTKSAYFSQLAAKIAQAEGNDSQAKIDRENARNMDPYFATLYASETL